MRSETNRRTVDARNIKVESKRRYPIGAELIGASETHFRIWAPKARTVDLVLEESAKPDAKRSFQPLKREDDGYFSGTANIGAGTLYRFRVDNAGHFHPDPASRFQPYGPHGSSCVVDPAQFQWTDSDWPGIKMKGQVVYEMHVGTFTKEGTWAAAAEQLPELARIGITVLEMMPIADFPGNFGWGYDGVDLFAPFHLYGVPDDLRRFVDRAHSLGLAVILDVVYNHFGPDGNYVRVFSDHYFTKRYEQNDWGESINFDGPDCEPVREFFITNGRYWIEEFHFDGFRFDATQEVKDKSEEYIIGAIGRAAHEAARPRDIILVAENERQEAKLILPREKGGHDLDAVWNDDFHHAAVVALTGKREAYYTDYLGSPQEFISAAKYGYLFQGQPYFWQEAPRGSATIGASPESFVSFIENHDQVSNTAAGERLRFQSSPGRYRAMTALLLLGPWTPLLFQGEEFGASTPFVFFTDVGDGAMRKAIRKGRFAFLAQFPSFATKEVQERLPVPSDPTSFVSCKLDFSEREKNKELYDLHIDLLRLRRDDSRFREQIPKGLDGAVLGPASFVLRYFSDEYREDRLLVVNFGENRDLNPVPEPLLAPPVGFEWETLWSSESARYGGSGTAAVVTQDRWTLPAEATVALRLIPEKQPRKEPKRKK
ncbi:MAG TPA: malto-oligosyltrehalose trehalohydrolase [Chthoniobacterales bacterium]|nr:malto-oligosyltrehalose trehalohydrolase [Chthoniobacterales bacterium]